MSSRSITIPANSRTVELPGVGALVPYDQRMGELHRNNEKRRMGRPRQRVILERSAELQVYIYNVGPISPTVPCGSLGPQFIPGLPLDKVLLPRDFSVAGPLIIQGIPAEPYPDEGRNKWIEHEPEDFLGFGDNPGYHLALTIVGGSPQSSPQDNLTSRGLFVSRIPARPPAEPKEPRRKDGKAAFDLYEIEFAAYKRASDLAGDLYDDPAMHEKWEESVNKARAEFRAWAAEKCGVASQSYQNGTWLMIKEPLYFTLAHILKKTQIDCPWMKDTEEASDKKACIACGATMPSSKDKCMACGELQITEEAFKTKMDAIRKENSQPSGKREAVAAE